MRSTDMDYPA